MLKTKKPIHQFSPLQFAVSLFECWEQVGDWARKASWWSSNLLQALYTLPLKLMEGTGRLVLFPIYWSGYASMTRQHLSVLRKPRMPSKKVMLSTARPKFPHEQNDQDLQNSCVIRPSFWALREMLAVRTCSDAIRFSMGCWHPCWLAHAVWCCATDNLRILSINSRAKSWSIHDWQLLEVS